MNVDTVTVSPFCRLDAEEKPKPARFVHAVRYNALVTDRQTVRQTHKDSMYRASIAARGKNRKCIYKSRTEN